LPGLGQLRSQPLDAQAVDRRIDSGQHLSPADRIACFFAISFSICIYLFVFSACPKKIPSA